MNINTKIIYTITALFILLPLIAGAASAGLVPCGGLNQKACEVCDLLVLTQNVLEFALKMAFLVIIGFVVYGGFRWIFSLGKEENLKAGQQIITNAIIGLIIILTAWIIVNTVFWTIKQMGGDDYTGTWFHIECSEFDIFNIPETPDASVDDETPDDQDTGTEPEPESELECTDCGGYLLDGNICDEAECLSLGDCKYYNYIAWPGGFCKPKQNDDENVEEKWGDSTTISSPNQMCLPISHSIRCEDGFKIERSKCEAGENTTLTESKITNNGNDLFCEFTGNDNPNTGPNIELCYPPTGTLYIDCILDPDYISPEDQIESKKNEIEEKYPDLEGEWIQTPIESYGSTDCGVIDKEIKDGFCFATESTTLISESEIMGNGWFCNFKDDINSPNGKSFAYCVSENNETPVTPITPEPEPEPEPESNCTDCGGPWWSGDWCYEAECLSLGDCNFINTFGPGGKCEAN